MRLRPKVRGTILALGGVLFAGDLVAWHLSIEYVGAGMATVLGNTQVFWTALIARLLFGEALGRRYLWAVLLAFAGVALLSGVGSSVTFSDEHVLGVVLGLVTGLCYASYIVLLQRSAVAGRDADDPLGLAMITLAWLTLFTAVGSAGLGAVAGQSIELETGSQLGFVVAIALLIQVLAWLIISRGLEQAPASRAALVILMQPALATVWGLLVFGEDLSPLQIAGAGVTLAGVYLGSRARG
jgi:drug/metabolite transporter (DMT)-like permease